MPAISKTFREVIETEFDGFLAKFNFKRTKSDSDKNGFSVIYRNGELYVNIGGTLHPRDHPYYSWLTFGEGSDEMPESDWNSIALWRIIQEVSTDDHAKEKDLYEIKAGQSSEEVGAKVRAMLASCRKYGVEFLNGNLESFRRVRAILNKGREPYKIYTPNKQGSYTISFDEESSRLKKQFSE